MTSPATIENLRACAGFAASTGSDVALQNHSKRICKMTLDNAQSIAHTERMKNKNQIVAYGEQYSNTIAVFDRSTGIGALFVNCCPNERLNEPQPMKTRLDAFRALQKYNGSFETPMPVGKLWKLELADDKQAQFLAALKEDGNE